MFGGLPGSFLNLAFTHAFTLATSPVLLNELDDKLRIKFKVAPEDADLIRSRLETTALLVEPEMTITVIKDDPDDDRVLECALAAEADYIVSGDRHLLKLASTSAGAT